MFSTELGHRKGEHSLKCTAIIYSLYFIYLTQSKVGNPLRQMEVTEREWNWDKFTDGKVQYYE